jgi:hypothetical protein
LFGWQETVLGQFQIVAYPQLADQSIAQIQSLPQDLLLLPVGLREMHSAVDDPARALPAFSHAAAVRQVRIRELSDAGPDDEVGVFLDFALMDLAILVYDDFGHIEFSASTRSRLQRIVLDDRKIS